MNEPKDLSPLSHLGPELARTFVSIASDIALVLDADGVILNAVAQTPAGFTPTPSEWVGRRWVETVTGETRGKIDQLLHEVTSNGLSRRREVNHPSPTGTDVPIAYAAIRLGEKGPVLAVGRDLRAIASIQQRFVETQQQMEREYWQHRQAESRYRLLFQVGTDAVMVVDAASLCVLDANRAAAQLFDFPLEGLLGKSAAVGIEPLSRNAVEEMLATARATGGPAEIRARIIGKTTSASISATPFRSDNAMLLLVRARAVGAREPSSANTTFAKLVETMPDPVVVTDSSGRVLTANLAFLNLCGVSGEGMIKGKSLADWIGQAKDDMQDILQAVRLRGIAPQVPATLTSAHGRTIDIEVTATLLEEQDQECIGFTMRTMEPAPADQLDATCDLAVAVAAIAKRVGLDPLPQLTRESTRLFERHAIAQAFSRCNGNRHRAAEFLGVTVAGLDLIMRQHGLVPDEPLH